MNTFLIYIVLAVLLTCTFLYTYWRFLYFFRDPEREIPPGDNIVSPADGTIVYIKRITDGSVPILIKKKRKIILTEILGLKLIDMSKPYYLVGIFMHPTSVHVNRAPVRGVIKNITYTHGRNLPMTAMWLRVLLRIKPYELYSPHVISNERNTILIDGSFPVCVTQIADIYVKKIECWVKEGANVNKGQRIGMIKMGSQVDIIFPCVPNIELLVREGEKVKAGESVLAEIN